MKLREAIEEAAFWHEAVCIGCGSRDENPSRAVLACECEESNPLVLDAGEVLAFLNRLEAEKESNEED